MSLPLLEVGYGDIFYYDVSKSLRVQNYFWSVEVLFLFFIMMSLKVYEVQNYFWSAEVLF